MQLSNIYEVSKTKLYGKMNSINTPIFRGFFYVKAVWDMQEQSSSKQRTPL